MELENQKLKEEENKLSGFLSDPNSLLSKLDSSTKNSLLVNLISKKQFYEKLNLKFESCKEYFNISRFPSLFFTQTISKRINRDSYIGGMESSLEKGNLKITYLTNLDISRVYSHALNIFNNKENAKKETELAVNRFCELVKRYDSLQVYYSEKKPDWEFIIPFNAHPKEIFLVLRSKDDEESPGILHIISHDVAEKAFNIIEKSIGKAEKVDKNNIKRFEKSLLASLNRL